MEDTAAQPTPASPRRSLSQATLGLQSESEKYNSSPSSSHLLLRRASCRDYRAPEQSTPPYKRGGSLKSRSSSVMLVAAHGPAHGPAQTSSHLSKEREEKSSDKTNTTKLTTPTPQTDKSLFLNFDNIKEALFGDSKVLSPNKSGEKTNLERKGQENGRSSKDISMQNCDKCQKAKSPVKDEFTEFSQYGSRFLPSQMDGRSKKTNLVDQLTGYRMVKKVAKTCQKHSISRKSTTTNQTTDESSGHKEGKEQEIETEAPTALPRRRDKQNPILPSENPKGEPEKFDPKLSAQLFKNVEQHQSICMNTDPKPQQYSLSEVAKPSSSRGSIKLRGFSSKSDSDSGFDGDSVGEIKIKQVGGINIK